MPNLPNWFNENEYFDFLTESSTLLEMNVEYQKQKFENRKKLSNFEREKALQRGRLKSALTQDLYRAKARGIQKQRLIGESLFEDKIREIHETFIKSLLSEAESKRTPIKREKHKMRPEVDPNDRERDRKRESRRQEKQEGLNNIIIVKNTRLNKIEIITKQDFNKETHNLLKGKVKKQDKGNVSKRDLTYYSKLENFMNTKTSIKLLGGRVEREVEKKSKQRESNSEESGAQSRAQQMPPPRPRTPPNGKEMTDPTSTFPEWDHTSDQIVMGVDDALNSMTGREPSPEYQQYVATSRTYGDAMQRFAKEIYSAFPAAGSMQFAKLEPVLQTGKLWASMGIPQSAPTAIIVGQSQQGMLGVSVKIGQQLRPMPRGEIGPIFNLLMNPNPEEAPNETLTGSFDIFVKDFIEELRKTFSAQTIPLAMLTNRDSSNTLARKKWETETTQNTQKTLLTRAGELVERYINENYDLKAALLLEALTGNMKFDGGMGSAQMMFTAKKDGTNARAIPLDQNFALTLAKSSDTDLNIQFAPTPNSSGGFLQNVFSKLNPLMEGNLAAIGDLEGAKNQMSTPAAFLQMFELQITDATYKTPIEYGDFYAGDSEANNVIIFNQNTSSEHQIEIPVQRNYDPQGEEENIVQKGADALLETYLLLNDVLVDEIKTGDMDIFEALDLIESEFGMLDERNYEKEYKNYQGKPEQIANRTSRVLARRKLEKEGKVKKGDGKDVDHKDGNPKNNNSDNLRVMSKSKNRSMNEDHGAGFEGTPEMLERFLKDTPFSSSPIGRGSFPYPESQLDKRKQKKK